MSGNHQRSNTCLIVQPDRDPPSENAAGHGEPEHALRGGLRRRGLRIASVQGGPEAMVGLARQPVNWLIVIEPRAHPRLNELLDAVRRYYPRTVCWGFHLDPSHLAQGQPRLERLQGPPQPLVPSTPAQRPTNSPQAEPASQSPAPEESAPPRPPSSPAASPPPAPFPHPAKADHHASNDQPLVSDEELAMLLGE